MVTAALPMKYSKWEAAKCTFDRSSPGCTYMTRYQLPMEMKSSPIHERMGYFLKILFKNE